jgi:hypothetical protein
MDVPKIMLKFTLLISMWLLDMRWIWIIIFFVGIASPSFPINNLYKFPQYRCKFVSFCIFYTCYNQKLHVMKIKKNNNNSSSSSCYYHHWTIEEQNQHVIHAVKVVKLN